MTELTALLALSWWTIFVWCLKAVSALMCATLIVVTPLAILLGWIQSKVER